MSYRLRTIYSQDISIEIQAFIFLSSYWSQIHLRWDAALLTVHPTDDRQMDTKQNDFWHESGLEQRQEEMCLPRLCECGRQVWPGARHCQCHIILPNYGHYCTRLTGTDTHLSLLKFLRTENNRPKWWHAALWSSLHQVDKVNAK